MSFFRRRLSKSDRDRDNNRLSHHSDRGPISPTSPPTSYNMPNSQQQHPDQHHSRPASSTAMSDGSYDFATHHNPNPNMQGATVSPVAQQNTSHRFATNPQPTSATSASRQPVSHALPAVPHSGAGTLGNLSRTDQVVLRYFWEAKAEENLSRDLHFLKFPSFGHAPSDRELVPFCEIYALVKNSKGAEIVGLGTLGNGAGTFIGFELFSAAQLHIDLSDTWTVPISHHRVHFKPFSTLFASNSTSSSQDMNQIASSWPKPLTIEFLEELYSERWARDLNAPCWESREVRELGGPGVGGAGEEAEDESVVGGHEGVGEGNVANGNALPNGAIDGRQRVDTRRHEDPAILGEHTVGI